MVLILQSLATLSTQEQCDDLKSFFKSRPTPSQSRVIAKCIENAEINASFRTRSGATLTSWLADTAKAGGESNAEAEPSLDSFGSRK